MDRALGTLLWVLGIVILSVLVASVLILPGRLIEWDLGHAISQLEPPELAKAKNDIRATLLQGIGGLLLLTGAAIGAAVSLRQLAVNRQGQITERFTRAIDQLGNDSLEVRLGGIYGLERISKDSDPDRRAIAEVLTAYIRHRSPWPAMEGPSTMLRSLDDLPWLRVRAPDVQAAVDVLGRRQLPMRAEAGRLNLNATDLRRSHLQEVNFANAALRGSNLHGAWMLNADLRGALLEDAEFEDAHLEGADLRGARLRGAKLSGARKLGDAKFDGNVEADDKTTWPTDFSQEAAKKAGVQLDQSPTKLHHGP